ncbi:low molecular weight protein tyrosine phosphatase family protein [Enhygromyxa salina]|uniref:Low molecular weight phosphotyrosine protein phosphatase n=1 Tax=Enhygromyxa salina TaxID=215803 RepID=A0A2S9YR86_9BACT|nr:protein tyrosine phosphatase [Enhygromyxa salina]PRQ07607.1 Low molecular weight phosphotyrosine protein phosphatase [Enhygromyxa salina]
MCSRNQWRSPTAERVFAADPRLAVRSAGTSARARRTLRVEDLNWADVVLVMEHGHAQRIRASFARVCAHLPIHVLDIPDEYRAMDPALVELLEVAVPPVLEQYFDVDETSSDAE